MKKRFVSKIIAAVLVLVTLLSMAVPGYAIEWEGTDTDYTHTPGESSGGGWSGSSILSYTASRNLLAYRFTYIKADGTVLQEGSKDEQSVLEIWIDNPVVKDSNDKFETNDPLNGYGYFAGDDEHVGDDGKDPNNPSGRDKNGNLINWIVLDSIFPKLSKRDYVLGIADKTFKPRKRTESEGGLAGSVMFCDEDYFIETAGSYFVTELTYDYTKVDEWCRNPDNLDIVAECLGAEGGVKGMAYGDKIIVEPVFYLYVQAEDESYHFAMTPTEIAAFAMYAMGEKGSSVGGQKKTDSAGNTYYTSPLYNVARYSNIVYPISLYTENGMGLWGDVTSVPQVGKYSGEYSYNDRLPMSDIINDGYGVAICYDETNLIEEQFDVAATGVKIYADAALTQELDASKLTYGQQVYVKYNYTNYSDRPVYVDAFDANGNAINSATALYMGQPDGGGGVTATVNGGSFTVNWVGASKLSSTVRIAANLMMPAYSQYPGLVENVAEGKNRFMPITQEANAENQQGLIGNNYRELSLMAKYDVAITNIILSSASSWDAVTPENTYAELDADGNTVIYDMLPFGETIYVYHTYQNNAAGTMNVTGYNSQGNAITVNGMKEYSIPAGHRITVRAENFIVDADNVTKDLVGSVYWTQDSNKEMLYETNRENNEATLNAGTLYDLAIHNIIFSTADKWEQVNESNIIYQLDENGDTVYYEENGPIYKDDAVYVYHTYSTDTATDISANAYVNGTLTDVDGKDKWKMKLDDGMVTKSLGKLDTSIAGDFNMTGAIYRAGKNNPTGESNVYNNLLDIDYTILAYDIAVRDIRLYADVGLAQRLDPAELIYGQTVYVVYEYVNGSSVSVKVDGYNTNDKLLSTATGRSVLKESATTVNGGSFGVNWVGNSSMDGTVRIVDDINAEPHEDYTKLTDNGRLLPLERETHPDNKKGLLGNNYMQIAMTSRYDVAIKEIVLKDSTGKVLNPTKLPFGETIYVYHVYENNAYAPINITGYRTNGTAISYSGSTSYAVPAQSTMTILAETYVTDADNTYRALVGSVYKSDDKEQKMEWETNNQNNKTSLVATTSYDLAITNIIFKDARGNIVGQLDDSGNVVTPDGKPLQIYRGEKISVYHTYTSDTPKSIQVNAFVDGKKAQVDGGNTFFIAGMLTPVTKLVGTLDTTELGEFSMTGAIYAAGKDNADTESNRNNNTASITYEVVEGLPWLEAIEPNAAYREGTEVITSFYVHNDTSVVFDPNAGLRVRMWVCDTDTGAVMLDANGDPIMMEQDVVVPANEVQLIYYRWTVPTLANRSNTFTIFAEFIIDSRLDNWTGTIQEDFYTYKDWTVTFTPDTEYEANRPNYWNKPSTPQKANNFAAWTRWEYINGSFEEVKYGVLFQPSDVSVTPSSVTAYRDKETGQLITKSGYGFELDVSDTYAVQFGSYKTPDSNAYTLAQYCYALFPEFEYKARYTRDGETINGAATLEPTGNGFELYEFIVQKANGEEKNYGRVHWTPIWYPDGKYFAQVIQEDIWTPAGAVTTKTVSECVVIDGNMYDDWYIGHG